VHALTRTVRLGVLPHDAPATGRNTFAGYPSMESLGAHYECDVRVAGEPSATTGYLKDIKDIDRAVHRAVLPIVTHAFREGGGPVSKVLMRATDALARELPELRSLRVRLTPTYSLEMDRRAMNAILLRQRFDFAAAHRLHVPTLSAEENQRVFGKCNNPRGHGHNYQFEPAIRVRLGEGATQGFTLSHLEALADRVLLQRFDHKHLNEDTEEFATGTGVNPSVENIARVFFDLLAPEVRKSASDAELLSITVWETDRTSATFPA
jgi:6-pyruvoyltetrahydropterin/6-carboxytetrahydropterin synthase